MSTPALAPTSTWRDRVLGVAAAGETATGLALLLLPATVIRLQIGTPGVAATGVVGRGMGMALIALGVACWPGRDPGSGSARALRGMLIYTLLMTAYLVALGIRRQWVGPLLWPAALVHAAFTLLLGAAWLGGRAGGRRRRLTPIRSSV